MYKKLNKDFREEAEKILNVANTVTEPNLEQVLPRLGSDHLIGMLHAFTLLKPHI